MDEPNRGGRPRSDTPRTIGIMVRVTPEERDALEAAARAAGVKQTARWLRELGLVAAARDA